MERLRRILGNKKMENKMSAYQTADADRDSLDRDAALADYIVDSARECGVDRACDWCPHYHVTVGVCHYGSRWPECRVGRILREEGIA